MVTPPPVLNAAHRAALAVVFRRAQRIGLLGEPAVDEHVDHALTLAACVPVAPSSLLDLGSGAGVPGLVLALVWPQATVALLDSQHKRAAHLRTAVAELGIAERCTVLHGRAETLAHDASLREAFGLVVARAFGSPAATAECASGFVAVGGHLLVSEPPESAERWSVADLLALGFGAAMPCGAGGARGVLIPKEEPAGVRWPRRAGTPTKQPLW